MTVLLKQNVFTPVVIRCIRGLFMLLEFVYAYQCAARWVCAARSLFFCVVFNRSLFVLLRLVIVLSVLWFMNSVYPLGVFKLFLKTCTHVPDIMKHEEMIDLCPELCHDPMSLEVSIYWENTKNWNEEYRNMMNIDRNIYRNYYICIQVLMFAKLTSLPWKLTTNWFNCDETCSLWCSFI